MSFYDFDTDDLTQQLLPGELRQPKTTAWFKVLMKPLQWLRDLFFDSYIAGSNDTFWDSSTTFFPGSRCVYFDNAVYESLQTNSATEPNLYPDYWIKVQDCYIGVDERLKYSSQIITYEYALNKWFRNIGAADQIYIENNATYGDAMLLANSSDLTTLMANQSIFSTSFMGNSYAASTQYDYTIYVPATLMATLGPTLTDQENTVRQVAELYNMVGMQYNIDTF